VLRWVVSSECSATVAMGGFQRGGPKRTPSRLAQEENTRTHASVAVVGAKIFFAGGIQPSESPHNRGTC
jgi:hypothetical protein